MRSPLAWWAIVGLGPALLLALALSCRSQDGVTLPELGDPCDPRMMCSVGFCFGPPGESFCTTSCIGDESCPEGLVCMVEPSVQARLCLPGSRCDGDSDCPSGHRCDPATRTCHISVKRDLCGLCSTDAHCPEGGLCVAVRSTGERFCSGPCVANADCPPGYGCRSLEQDGVSYDGIENPRQCIPLAETCNAGKPLCSPCSGDWECGNERDLCLENRVSGERFCGSACNPSCQWDEERATFVDRRSGGECSSACPRGFSCERVGELDQCVPDSLGCDGFCIANSRMEERLQCGLGAACDRSASRCITATDGRTCSPCRDDADCLRAGEGASACLASRRTGESFCAEACETDGDCLLALGVGFVCADVEGAKYCIPRSGSCAEGMEPLGGACALAQDCAGGVCLLHGEQGICSGTCLDDEGCGDPRWMCCAASDDAPGYDCRRERSGEAGICVPRSGGFGDACGDGRPPCEGGFCLDIGTARLCTAGCAVGADCDVVSGREGAFDCRSAVVEPSETKPILESVCFPAGGGEVGSACIFGPAACADRICLQRKQGDVCTKPCQDDRDCPAGWWCGEARGQGADYLVCLPR